MSGTKVTTDPESLRNPKIENPGVVTSDSLAAESAKHGGDFAATSDTRGVLDQPSKSTTSNTTDDSNATRLDAASSRAERADGLSLADQASLGGSGTSTTTRVTRSQAAAAAAATADDAVPEPRPKGSNLKEGGEITGDEPNASFRTDIGSKNDPGRVALKKLEADNAASRDAAGARQYNLDSNTQYDTLGGSTSS